MPNTPQHSSSPQRTSGAPGVSSVCSYPRDAELLHPVAKAPQREDAGGDRLTAAVLAADATFAHVLAERTAVVPRVSPYRPGEFYLRELPPLRAVLDGLSGLGLLVVDGYADLDPAGRPGRSA